MNKRRHDHPGQDGQNRIVRYLHKKRLRPGTAFQSAKGPLHKIYPDEQDAEAEDDFSHVLDRSCPAEDLQAKADSYGRQGISGDL